MGFTCLDHLHPGSNLARPIVPPPIFTSSIFPFSNLRTSSGELRCLTSILDEGIDPLLDLHVIRLVAHGASSDHSNEIQTLISSALPSLDRRGACARAATDAVLCEN